MTPAALVWWDKHNKKLIGTGMPVFAVHPLADKDTSSALVYGDLKFINHRYIYADELDGDKLPHSFLNKMLKAVDDFDPSADYLLIAGDHLQIVALGALLAARWGIFRVLRYDRQAKGYIVVELDTIGSENAIGSKEHF